MITQDFTRTNRVAPRRFTLGFDDVGSRWDRTPTQRFEQLANEAMNKFLVPIGLMPVAVAEVLSTSVIPRLSANPGTFNSPAFVLVFCCYDFEKNCFREANTPSRKITSDIIREEGLSWPDLVRLIKNPRLAINLRQRDNVQIWETFLKSNGITVPDLVRYLIYAKQNLEGKIILFQDDF